MDILTLACLTAIVPLAFQAPEQAALRARRRNGRAGALVAPGRAAREGARRCSARPSDRALPDDLLFRTLWDIAALEKKLGREHAALAVLTDLAAARNPWRAAAFIELAKYYEHRERNYAMALEMTRNALDLEPSDATRRRLARLEKRISPRSGKLL